MRLNRFLAAAGLGSRRAVEQMIRDGRVAVNGQTVTQLATQVDERRDRVELDGRPVRPAAQTLYLMLNKPRGYDVTRGGRHHHRRVYDLLPREVHPSVQAVGRLDRNSTGLLLFTNDGDLNFRLTHPRHGCHKHYEVLVEGVVDDETLEIFREGIRLEDGPAQAVEVARLEPTGPETTRLRIVMAEGRKHIVRRMCEAAGHPVLELDRTAVGPVRLGDLARGKVRPLTRREVAALKRSVGLTADPPTRSGRP
ncbi:MAG TPA: pseudouridine synthase [Candidatus Sumerlaeota bacterium]|nr:pseudouridine synthase [Candidatus Sumerlaeota bacterium]HPK03967.1 pseudouridine synthase [Candidatus Sumerlaeota bacterium]